jgi:hypothetical protein
MEGSGFLRKFGSKILYLFLSRILARPARILDNRKKEYLSAEGRDHTSEGTT